MSKIVTQVQPSRREVRLRAGVLWLLAGTALLLLTPLSAHTALLGWAPALWLVGAPLIVLLVLEPCLPLHLLAACMRRRRWRPQHA